MAVVALDEGFDPVVLLIELLVRATCLMAVPSKILARLKVAESDCLTVCHGCWILLGCFSASSREPLQIFGILFIFW